MANKQIIGDVRVYSRHSAGCHHEKDAPYLRCDCPKWMQWQENGTPVRKPAGTRTIAGLKMAAEKKTKELRGEVVEEPSSIRVEQALKDWLAFREQNGLGNEKAKLMGRKLQEWVKANGLVYLREMTSGRVTAFRSSLSYNFGGSP